ncbi:hypothetical protein P280DRAFT_414544 [Massarina eburnea CBS 473.64]|uniref:Secreted protein n=1 Tax=Massarina eburnea CBS 473.64 TaxID=1395130 RepID=A0A6A6RG42_9PLEO|nr:hypothetical protein P280DRAFT_414544 [Massarina eburnea CBS 473.64]
MAAVVSALPTELAPTPAKITSLKISGSGCPNDSDSVKSTSGTLGDSASFTFGQLRGDRTDNCEIHIQSSGASQGWQIAVKEVAYGGNVQLSSGSSLDTVTQAFWSEKAGDTSTLKASLACAGPDIKDYVTVRSSTNDIKWSKCTGADGNPGILNVNFRPVIQGNSGTYDFKEASWGLVWRKC